MNHFPSGSKRFIRVNPAPSGMNTPQASNINTPCTTSRFTVDFVVTAALPLEKFKLTVPLLDTLCCVRAEPDEDAKMNDFVAPALALASAYRITSVLDVDVDVTFAALSEHPLPHGVDTECPLNRYNVGAPAPSANAHSAFCMELPGPNATHPALCGSCAPENTARKRTSSELELVEA